MQGYVNIQNCRIWPKENPFRHQPVLLDSEKVNEWCESTASFIIQPFSFEESCTMNSTVCLNCNPPNGCYIGLPMALEPEHFGPKSYTLPPETDLEDFEPQPGPSTSTNDDGEYPAELVHRQPHLVTQPELKDLVRDLELPKSKSQLLGSRL
ncbi:hypothetical protein AVEN_256006-1 [Araneus ventricosus]|uniref:Uncharacterized protein n=1 Tax=Araneus ventricosus TaxID=182803 RepID=A0A4Y2N1V3_ARAVE|nr:hypothetical protein AVEN_256006-1 [Araneus ventricosus]